MKELKQQLKNAIAEQVCHDSYGTRKLDDDTGQILEPYQARVSFGFQVNARSQQEAEKIINFEAQKFFNDMFE